MFSTKRYLLRWVLVGFTSIFFIMPGANRATELSVSLDLSNKEISYSTINQYDLVRIPGYDLTDRLGEPQLPVKLVHVVLPAGSRVKGVEVVRVRSREIPGEFLVYPAQKPEILPIPGFPREKAVFIEPVPSTYQSPDPYPGELVKLVSTGNMGSYKVASLLVYPLQWVPKTKRLIYYSEIEFKLDYEPSQLPFIRGGSNSMDKIAKALVLNPEAVQSKSAQSGECEYLIITSPGYAVGFQPLADWKTQKGIPACIVTTDSIYQNFQGNDEAEKIRNFIKYAYENLGTQWVLLGGDTDVVPDRIAYAMTCEAGYMPDEDSLRADLYYSDLDGTWDLNGNGIYGEVADSVDLYPEVFVGRAPVNTMTEVNNFVNKILIYEKNPRTDYQLDILFLAEILWWDPYTDAGVGKDIIDSLYVPPRFDPVFKLYERNGNENPATAMWALDQGQNLINHDGHGWYNYMGVGEGGLSPSDMDSLENGIRRQSILYSIGCWVGAFHYDAISEHWINNPSGGGVAFIGNSSYGWGSPGNPGFGYSDRFDATFYEKLFIEEVNQIGATLALTKAHYIPRSREANVYRWHQYQINLLGDPEMSIWTDIPSELTVSFPESISIGASSLPITVESNGAVEGALVCLSKDGEVYERDYTDLAGRSVLDVFPSTPGVLRITVTAKNYLPFEDSIIVYSQGPYVGYLNHQLSGGNHDQEMNPGEVLNIGITVQNFGTDTAYDVSATLSSTDSLVSIIDSVYNFGVLQPGDTATGLYTISVSSEIENGHTVFFTLVVTDGMRKWENSFSISAATPLLSFWRYDVDDAAGGNGNGIPEPGESLGVYIWIRNTGFGLAREVTGWIESTDPHIYMTDTISSFWDIPLYSVASGSFALEVDESCPVPYFAELLLLTSTSDGYTSSDTFTLVIGETAFSDDMEGGPGGWSHGGAFDLWHLTSHRAHSGAYSWYCGDASYVYHNWMDCYLLSSPIVIAPGSGLSFWHWYDVTIYGVDGLYVEILHGLDSDTLDFIGSGGALDSLLIGNPWIEEVYELSNYQAGDTIRVRFSFVSDGYDVAEGFYIDDVRVGPLTSSEPDPPVLIYPPDSCLTDDPTPTFRWSSTAGPDGHYTLQYSTDRSFIGDVTTIEMLSNPMYTIPSASSLDNGVYYWRVKAVDKDGLESDYQIPYQFTVNKVGVDIGDVSLSRKFAMSLKPNPFTKTAVINYQLPRATWVSLKIYDSMGRVISELVDGPKSAGYHHITWDGRSDSGEFTGVGVYFCKLQAGMYTSVEKLILLK